MLAQHRRKRLGPFAPQGTWPQRSVKARHDQQTNAWPRSESRRSFLFSWHSLAFLACLGERDGDRLFAAFHPAALSTFAAFRRARLVTAHLGSHFLAGARRVFSFPFLSH